MNKKTNNVIELDMITRLNLDPERVLNKARDKLDDVVILGYDKDGEFYFASSISSGPEVLWLLESLKKQLLEVK